MMKFTLLLAFLISLPLHAESIFLKDTRGQLWYRHIVVENQSHGGSLLAVIDEPLNKTELQQVVLRKQFSLSEKPQFQQALAAAHAMSPHVSPLGAFHPLVRTANPIWPIDHQWTDADEKEYSDWIHANAREDFLQDSGLDVDCADYAITLRWIYAHDHHLPAGDQLQGSGELFGSWIGTTTWDALPTNADWRQDERFKASLRFVLGNTFTHTIFMDLYPIKIDLDTVVPGAIFLTLSDDTGHTRTIFSFGPEGCPNNDPCIRIIWGNEPASEKGYITIFLPWRLDATEGGFLRFRWPELVNGVWTLRAPTDMPGYSIEQYSWDDASYLPNVATKLNLISSPEERFELFANVAFELILERVNVTALGYLLCSLVPCAQGDADYPNWSTPVRDHDLMKALQNVQSALAGADTQSVQYLQTKAAYNIGLTTKFPLTYWQVITQATAATNFSSDPTLDFLTRWGVTTISDVQYAYSLADILFRGWMNREEQVTSAQKMCFSSGPLCDPASPSVMALATDRIDQGLRLGLAQFTAKYSSLSDTDQKNVRNQLAVWRTRETLCGDPSKGCSWSEFLIDHPEHFANMSSNPLDPADKRFGF